MPLVSPSLRRATPLRLVRGLFKGHGAGTRDSHLRTNRQDHEGGTPPPSQGRQEGKIPALHGLYSLAFSVRGVADNGSPAVEVPSQRCSCLRDDGETVPGGAGIDWSLRRPGLLIVGKGVLATPADEPP